MTSSREYPTTVGIPHIGISDSGYPDSETDPNSNTDPDTSLDPGDARPAAAHRLARAERAARGSLSFRPEDVADDQGIPKAPHGERICAAEAAAVGSHGYWAQCCQMTALDPTTTLSDALRRAGISQLAPAGGAHRHWPYDFTARGALWAASPCGYPSSTHAVCKFLV
jgi:hypothetical protein